MPISQIAQAQLAPLTLAALRIVSGALFLDQGLVKMIGFPPVPCPAHSRY